MKVNIKPFDVSILSTYMGKWLTAIVAIFVIGVTVSALRSGHAERNIVDICVSTSAVGDNVFEPLRDVIGRETRRATRVSRCDKPRADWDLYVMTTADFLRYEDELGLEALYEIAPTEGLDRALIVSVPGNAADLASISARDIAFTDPGSVNGFLVQLSMLEDEGFDMPQSTADFRFEGEGGFGARLVLGVLYGNTRFGACRQSDVTSLISSGVIDPGELAVVRRGRALPENVIASHRSEASYYRVKLQSVSGVLERVGGGERLASNGRLTAALLRASGVAWLRPIDGERMNDARRLQRRFHALFDAAAE